MTLPCTFPECPHAGWKSPWEKETAPVLYSGAGTSQGECTRLHVPRRSLDFQYATAPATYGEPSKRHVLVVQTAPREPSSLGDTIASLARGGAAKWPGPRFISSDGSLTDSKTAVHLGWPLVESPSLTGSAKAFVRTLRVTLNTWPDVEYLTFIEDDVSCCENTLPYVTRTEVPADVALLSWFTFDYDFSSPCHPRIGPHPAAARSPVLATRSSRFFILTQAITLPRRTIDRILSCPAASRHWPKTHAHDELISWAVGDSLYAVHFPILFQHRMVPSAVSQAGLHLPSDPGNAQEGARTSPHYMGDDFDALSLLPRSS